MANSTVDIGGRLDSMGEALALAVVGKHYQLRPDFKERYGERGRQKCREDALYDLAQLAQAIKASSPVLFCEYVAWTKVVLAGRGISVEDLAENLRITIDSLKEGLAPDDAAVACAYIEGAIAQLPLMPANLPTAIAQGKRFTQLAESYLAALLACERNKASRLILDAVKAGVSIKDIYLHVFQESQHEIGRLWQSNRVTVAQEHYCTAATQMIMSQLYPQIFAGPRIGKTFVGTSVSGDLHEIGIRMVADFFEMDGWDTLFLGSSLPCADLIKTLQDRKPSVVGISATITTHVPAVEQMVAAIRTAPGCANIKILVGGYPFLVVPELWRQVKADGTCPSAQGTVDLANQLISERKAA